MPRAYPKTLTQCADDVRIAYEKAFANPGATVVVQIDATMAEAKNLHARLSAVRSGFVAHYPPDHEYHRAAIGKRFHVNKEYDPRKPLVRTVTLRYSGMIKRPSEIVEDFVEQYRKGLRSTPY